MKRNPIERKLKSFLVEKDLPPGGKDIEWSAKVYFGESDIEKEGTQEN